MRSSLVLVLLLTLAGPAVAADTHPFSIHDMLALDRISDPRVSPDGTQVAFRTPSWTPIRRATWILVPTPSAEATTTGSR